MKLALFDMDGTLYNTNDINYYAYKEALDQYHVELDYNYYCEYCNGRHYKVFIPQLVDNDLKKVEDIHNYKKQSYSKYLNKVKINEHLFHIIQSLKSEYKIILVTTASKKNTLEILNYTDKVNLFDDIITGEDIKNTKPDPEGFLKAINKYNAKPEDVIIFEDSLVGVEAARKTGASVYIVDKF